MNINTENTIALIVTHSIAICLGVGIMFFAYPVVTKSQPTNTLTLCTPCHESKPWIKAKTDADLHDLRARRRNKPKFKQADLKAARAAAEAAGM